MTLPVKQGTRKLIDDMLEAIGKDEATNCYNIIRLVAAFPLKANLSSDSAEVKKALYEDKRKHALAQLSGSVMTSALATTTHGASIMSMLNDTLGRTQKKAADKTKAGQPGPKSRRTNGQ